MPADPKPMSEAESALRQLVNHPLLLDLFGEIEDSGTKESTRLFGYVKAWIELRDETLANLAPEAPATEGEAR